MKIDGEFLNNLMTYMLMHMNITINTTDAIYVLSHEIRQIGLKMNTAKTNLMVVDNTPNELEQCADRKC